MRIGLVCPYSLTVPGGVQNQVMAMARSLRRRGHQARVLAPCDGAPPASFVTPLGASVPNPANGSIAPIAPDPQAQMRLLAALADEDFDLVHLHEPAVPGPCMTTVFLKPAPLVGTFHAAGEIPAYGALAPLARWGGRQLDVRVVVSEDALSLVDPVMDGPWVRLFNGIEIAPWRDAEPWPAEEPGTPAVLFLGRHEPRKGLRVLLESLRHVGEDFVLWVAGEGDETESLRARFLDPRIRWLGRIDDRERERRMATADVFCAPSLGGESFGVILLEAMAAGTPVVASAIPGYEKVASEAAPDGSVPSTPAAELVTPGDPEALGAALARVLGSPQARERLRSAGTDRVARFDMEVLVERYEELYAQVLDRAGSGVPSGR
ncbi:MAG: glycosyltransferase family 4 protein [Microthrixaceae bacterium]